MHKPHPLDLILWIDTFQSCERRELAYYADRGDRYKVISWYSRSHPKYGQ